MKITTWRNNVPAELIVRHTDGTEEPADLGHAISACREAGCMVLEFERGQLRASATPDWLTDAAEEFYRRRRGGPQ